MNATLYAMDALQTGTGFMMACLLGILFGFFLEQAGFGSSRRLTGIFYFKDMAVLKVMFTAVVVAMVGYHYLVALGWLRPAHVYMLDTYWLAQIIGGLIFGAGFVMGGWCPGTAVVGVASAKLDALVFLAGVVLGSVLFNELFFIVRPIYESLHGGTLFLYDSLNVPRNWLILIFALIAIAMFTGSSWIERLSGIWPGPSPARLRRRVLAASALALAAAGLLVTPERTPRISAGGFPAGFLSEVAGAEDHIDAMELSRLITAGNPGLVVVDLRSPEEYDQFHLRGAIHIPLERLPAEADARLPRDGLVVLYSNGTTHAAQAWLELRHWGWTNARVLTDGLLGFWRECLTPPSLSGLIDEQTSKGQFAAFAARKAFFDRDLTH